MGAVVELGHAAAGTASTLALGETVLDGCRAGRHAVFTRIERMIFVVLGAARWLRQVALLIVRGLLMGTVGSTGATLSRLHGALRVRRACGTCVLPAVSSVMSGSLLLTGGVLGAARQRLEALMSLALALLRGRASLRARLRRLIARHVDADDSSVSANTAYNARHLIELGRLELFDDVLQLRLLN